MKPRPAPRGATFTRFVERLGVTLTPGQRVIARVAFDGVEPCDLGFADRELAKRIFGDVERIPAEARHVLVAVCGARGGKSYVLVALRMLHQALTVSLATLAPGEHASGIIVAPDLRLARHGLRYVTGAIAKVPELAEMVRAETSETVTIRRPDGVVTIECLPATRGGSALRGRSLVGAALDEAAFFRDDSYQVNDVEVFKAVAPRVMAGGQVVIASTPWAEAGLLYDFFRANRETPTTAMAAHAPTTLLRDDARTRGLVERERQRDPENASREFDAEFMGSAGGQWFDSSALEAAVVKGRELPVARAGGSVIAMGVDAAFVRDASAGVVVQRVGRKYVVSDVLELRPERRQALRPSAVAGAWAEMAGRYGLRQMVGDGHAREPMREHLEARNIVLQSAPEGQSGKVKVYTKARALLHEGRVELPEHSRLARQLREVQGRPTPGGGIQIVSPRRGGAHGDLVSAFVLALWRADAMAGDDESDVELSEEERAEAELERRYGPGSAKEWWERDPLRPGYA